MLVRLIVLHGAGRTGHGADPSLAKLLHLSSYARRSSDPLIAAEVGLAVSRQVRVVP